MFLILESNYHLLIQLAILFIVPVILILTGVIPVKYRLHLMLGVGLIVLGIVIREQTGLFNLGVRLDNLTQSIWPYVIFTVLGVLFIVYFAWIFNKKFNGALLKNQQFLLLLIPMTAVQEFVFRGYLMPKLELIYASAFIIIALNTFIFAFAHLIYPNRIINIPRAIIFGIVFAAFYFYLPNLILIIIVHAILNLFAALYGFFEDEELVLY